MKKTLATIFTVGALAVGGGTIEMVSAPIDTAVAFKTVEWNTSDGELHEDEYAFFNGAYFYRDAPIEESEPKATTTDISKGKTEVSVRCEGCRAYTMGQDPLTGRWNRTLVSVAEYDTNITTKDVQLIKTTAKRTLLENMGTVAEGAVAHGHSTAGETGAGGPAYTSLSFSHDATGDSILLLGFNVRPDVTSLSVSFNSVAMSLVGSLVTGGDTLEHAYLYSLLSPSSGSYTVSISWSTSAALVAGATSYTGGYGTGTFASGDCGAGSASVTGCTATATLASGEIMHAMLASDGYEINTSCVTGTQRSESQDVAAYAMQNTCTNTGTGSTNVAWNGDWGKIWVAVPVTATAPYTALPHNILYGTWGSGNIANTP
jgi:hypothetical protein